MSKVAHVDLRNPEAPALFAHSLKNTGFAVIAHHSVPHSLISDTYKEWEEFFKREEKQRYLYDAATQSGYFPFKSENAKGFSVKDLKEFYHVYKFEDIPPSFSAKTKELYLQLVSMGTQLLKWLDEQTPTAIRSELSCPLHEMLTGSRENLLRILHYPPLTGAEETGAIRAAAHEDINLITVLPAATTPGLQVKDLHGAWYDIECDPGNLVINAGDMLQMCTQHYYKSTTHQVVNPLGAESRKSRYSMPMFLHPRRDVVLSPKNQPRITAGQYLDERLREIGLLKTDETHATP